MSEEDIQKIMMFKKVFKPNNLPEEVMKTGLYTCGSDVNNVSFEQEYEQRRKYESQVINPHAGIQQIGYGG